MQQLKVLLSTPLVVLLASCMPLLIQQQPAITFQVEDHSGGPIAGAEIHFIRYSTHPFPGTAQYWATVVKTNAIGQAAIEEKSEWQFVIFAPDAGPVHYDWAWCIAKDGYTPASEVGLRELSASESANVVLSKNSATGDCVWIPGYRGGKFQSPL